MRTGHGFFVAEVVREFWVVSFLLLDMGKDWSFHRLVIASGAPFPKLWCQYRGAGLAFRSILSPISFEIRQLRVAVCLPSHSRIPAFYLVSPIPTGLPQLRVIFCLPPRSMGTHRHPNILQVLRYMGLAWFSIIIFRPIEESVSVLLVGAMMCR